IRIVEGDVLAFEVTEIAQPVTEGVPVQRVVDDADARDLPRLLRARRERPRRRTTEQRYELAASHCPMPPVLPTERIAHLGTADSCINPPGRNEMIGTTPPKFFSKEVPQKQATPFPRQDLLIARNRF